MIVVEICLLALLLCSCVYATMSDIRASIIENRLILYAAAIGLVLNGIYYSLFAGTYIMSFLYGFFIAAIISVLFYAFHFWAAGDSKFMILVSFLLPARMWGWESGGTPPIIVILIVTFSVAFMCVIIESVVLGIGQRNLFLVSNFKGSILRFLKSYVIYGSYLTLLNQLVIWILPDLYMQYSALFMIGSFFVAVLIGEVEILKKPFVFIPCLIFALCLTGYTLYWKRVALDPIAFIVLLGIVLMRIVAEKYNYQEIKTDALAAGMVLSYASVLRINATNSINPALVATEDVRSRLSAESANQIQAWGNSKYGLKTVIIVRKIPFAIFISIGTVVFVLLRMWAP